MLEFKVIINHGRFADYDTTLFYPPPIYTQTGLTYYLLTADS